MSRLFSIIHAAVLTGLLLLVVFPTMGHTENPDEQPTKYYDIYLVGNRICKQCTWEFLNPQEVRLINKQGISTTYPVNQIQGVDKHPIWRRIFKQMVKGNGQAGSVIVGPPNYDPTNPINISPFSEYEPFNPEPIRKPR